MNVLLVEDEADLARPLLALLRRHHQVQWAPSKEGAFAALAELEADLLVVDVALADGEDAGFELVASLREAGYAGAVLFLTARGAVEDRVLGLRLGGDDYLTKPFHFDEFLARVEARLRQRAERRSDRIELGELQIDFGQRRLYRAGQQTDLSRREFDLLELLVRDPDRTYSVDELADRLFPGRASAPQMVRVYAYRLRSKLGADLVETLPGGYRCGLR